MGDTGKDTGVLCVAARGRRGAWRRGGMAFVV